MAGYEVGDFLREDAIVGTVMDAGVAVTGTWKPIPAFTSTYDGVVRKLDDRVAVTGFTVPQPGGSFAGPEEVTVKTTIGMLIRVTGEAGDRYLAERAAAMTTSTDGSAEVAKARANLERALLAETAVHNDADDGTRIEALGLNRMTVMVALLRDMRGL